MCRRELFVQEDELEKLRSTLVHAHDKPLPLTRRLIEAMKRRSLIRKQATNQVPDQAPVKHKGLDKDDKKKEKDADAA
jgi:hypothetical protein